MHNVCLHNWVWSHTHTEYELLSSCRSSTEGWVVFVLCFFSADTNTLMTNSGGGGAAETQTNEWNREEAKVAADGDGGSAQCEYLHIMFILLQCKITLIIIYFWHLNAFNNWIHFPVVRVARRTVSWVYVASWCVY